jgi:hypothetical protein
VPFILPALLGWVAAGPPAFELPPAVPPGLCAHATVLISANAAASVIDLKLMTIPQLLNSANESPESCSLGGFAVMASS